MIRRIVTQLLILSLLTMNLAWAVDQCAITHPEQVKSPLGKQDAAVVL